MARAVTLLDVLTSTSVTESSRIVCRLLKVVSAQISLANFRAPVRVGSMAPGTLVVMAVRM